MLFSFLEPCHRTPWKPLLYDEFWFVIHCGWGSVWFFLRIFKIWFYFDFYFFYFQKQLLPALLHNYTCLFSLRGGRRVISRTGTAKSQHCGGRYCALLIFLIQPALLLFDLPDPWLERRGSGDQNVWQKYKATSGNLVAQRDFVYFSVLHITFLSGILTVLCNLKILSDKDNVLPHVCNF